MYIPTDVLFSLGLTLFILIRGLMEICAQLQRETRTKEFLAKEKKY